MELGHERRSFLPGRDGNDSGLRMAQQDLDQLSRCVSGPAENSDFDHREFLNRLRQLALHILEHDAIIGSLH